MISWFEGGPCQLERPDAPSSIVFDPFCFSGQHPPAHVRSGKAKWQRRADTGAVMQVDGRGFTGRVKKAVCTPRAMEDFLGSKTMTRSFDGGLSSQRLEIGSKLGKCAFLAFGEERWCSLLLIGRLRLTTQGRLKIFGGLKRALVRGFGFGMRGSVGPWRIGS